MCNDCSISRNYRSFHSQLFGFRRSQENFTKWTFSMTRFWTHLHKITRSPFASTSLPLSLLHFLNNISHVYPWSSVFCSWNISIYLLSFSANSRLQSYSDGLNTIWLDGIHFDKCANVLKSVLNEINIQ